MELFQPELETCPICGSTGNCHIHDYYDRCLIEFHDGTIVVSHLCVMRVMCDSCAHAHAILPDIIVPYSRYSILFLLQVLAAYFYRQTATVDSICTKFNISHSQLYKWLALWERHKSEWLGVLNDLESSNVSFLEYLRSMEGYSSFAQEFTRRFAFSFLQIHKNPVPVGMPIRDGTAGYCQQVFTPDYSIW